MNWMPALTISSRHWPRRTPTSSPPLPRLAITTARVGSTLCPADVFVALDDAGNIWTLGYVYYNNEVKLYTLDDVEKTTLPS